MVDDKERLRILPRTTEKPSRTEPAEGPGGRLSLREMDVLRLVAIGLSNKQIATRLSISEPTVKAHVSSILAKLQITGRTQAAIYALRAGIM